MEKTSDFNTPELGYRYVLTAMRENAELTKTSVTAIGSALGQTSLTYAKKYWCGELDLRTNNLVLLCNRFGWSPLSFFTLCGHRFTTPLRHLYIMESAGFDLATLLKEKGIEIGDAGAEVAPQFQPEFQPMTQRSHRKHKAQQEPVPQPAPQTAAQPEQESQAMVNMLKTVIESQNQLIESKNMIIKMLREELAKAETGRSYFGAVADDSPLGAK